MRPSIAVIRFRKLLYVAQIKSKTILGSVIQKTARQGICVPMYSETYDMTEESTQKNGRTQITQTAHASPRSKLYAKRMDRPFEC